MALAFSTWTLAVLSVFFTIALAAPSSKSASAEHPHSTDVAAKLSQPTAYRVTVNEPTPTRWAAPNRFTDLSCFKVTKFACGQENLKLVDTSRQRAVPVALNALEPVSVDPETVMEITYPANSINPGNAEHPLGGAEIYASPLDITQAQNITLEYSIFFPSNFSFMLGGKLPGLYGGRPGCSGGDDANDCFSTRLMWREKGAGELYLVSGFRFLPESTLC